jgi:hypothetical protein
LLLLLMLMLQQVGADEKLASCFFKVSHKTPTAPFAAAAAATTGCCR